MTRKVLEDIYMSVNIPLKGMQVIITRDSTSSDTFD